MPATAVILAGGLGTRLQPVVKDRPKVLAPVLGKPFLDYVLAYLAHQGMQRVVLSLGYLAGQVKDFAGDGQRWGLDIHFSEEQTPLGTGGALRQASHGLKEAFFALNGDTLFLADLSKMWLAHLRAQATATVALLPVDDAQERGCVTLAEGGKIIAFNEKPFAGQASHSNLTLVNAGVYVLEPAALASIPPGQPASLERQIFPQLAAQGKMAGDIQTAYFIDIGTPDSLAAFEQDVRSGSIPVLREIAR